MTLDGNGGICRSVRVPFSVLILRASIWKWVVVADIISAGILFQKEENGDTGIGLNIVRTGKIGVKGLVVEYGEYPVVYGEYSPTPSLKPLSRFANPESG